MGRRRKRSLTSGGGGRLAGSQVKPVEIKELSATPEEVAEFNLTDELFPVEDKGQQ